MLKRSRIRRVSKKRATENRKYLLLREKYLRDNPWCEIGASGCNRKAAHVHHRKGSYGKLKCDVRWFAAACYVCHDYIHFVNPKWARQKGWILT